MFRKTMIFTVFFNLCNAFIFVKFIMKEFNDKDRDYMYKR